MTSDEEKDTFEDGGAIDAKEYHPMIEKQGEDYELTMGTTDAYAPKWSWSHMVLSVISMFCCGWCGVVALSASLAAYSDHKAKDFERSRYKRKVARYCAITGIIVGLVSIILFVIIYIQVTRTLFRSPAMATSNNNGLNPNLLSQTYGVNGEHT